MSKFRKERINEEVAKVLSESARDIKDPRVSSSFVTVTRCDVSGDLKYAKVYFSVIGQGGEDAESLKEIKKGLYSASGFLRCRLAETLNLRITPELTFEFDDIAERGSRISRLLKEANEGHHNDENDGNQ